MICPQCGAEYRPGFTQCSDCLVDLVGRPVDAAESPPEGVQVAAQAQPQTPPSGHTDLVAVFRCGDPGRTALAKSLLQSAEIPFMVLNETMQDLIGAGRLAGMNVAIGPVEFRVDRRDADDARALLKDLE